MAWTVEQVISKFRDLTGRKTTNQMSDAAILIEANHYYQYVFPVKADVYEFKGWYTFNTADGVGYQDIPDSIITVSFPVYVNNDPATLWTDVQRFYEEYPHDYATENVPTDILLIDRQLILRPIPDAVYEARLRKLSVIPDALTTGDLDNSIYGPVIAYGSAIMFLMDKGERDIAEEHAAGYAFHLGVVRESNLKQVPVGKRPRGGRF